jgi:hypothetical protein
VSDAGILYEPSRRKETDIEGPRGKAVVADGEQLDLLVASGAGSAAGITILRSKEANPLSLDAKWAAAWAALANGSVPNPERGLRFARQFNDKGFRDPKNLQESAKTDWFVLGDSFSFGSGVKEEQRFSNLLENDFKTNGLACRLQYCHP